jgi:hypothetical protein
MSCPKAMNRGQGVAAPAVRFRRVKKQALSVRKGEHSAFFPGSAVYRAALQIAGTLPLFHTFGPLVYCVDGRDSSRIMPVQRLPAPPRLRLAPPFHLYPASFG